MHRPHRPPGAVHEQHAGDRGRPGEQRPRLARGSRHGQQRGRPHELPHGRPRDGRRDRGGERRNVHLRCGQPSGRREQLALHQLRAATTAAAHCASVSTPSHPRRTTASPPDRTASASTAPPPAASAAKRPTSPGRARGPPATTKAHRRHRPRPRRSENPHPATRRPHPGAPLRHMRVRRHDVDGHLPRQPPHLPYGVPQRGQPARSAGVPAKTFTCSGSKVSLRAAPGSPTRPADRRVAGPGGPPPGRHRPPDARVSPTPRPAFPGRRTACAQASEDHRTAITADP